MEYLYNFLYNLRAFLGNFVGPTQEPKILTAEELMEITNQAVKDRERYEIEKQNERFTVLKSLMKDKAREGESSFYYSDYRQIGMPNVELLEKQGYQVDFENDVRIVIKWQPTIKYL